MVLAACCQIRSTATASANLARCIQVVRRAAEAGAKCIFLPEASDLIARSGDETVRLTNQEGTSPSFLPGLQREARQLKVHITAGVHLPTEDAGRCANVSVWIDSEGEILHSYQKLHLFDVDIKNGPILKESKTTQPGSGMVEPFGTPIGRVGMQICYDLRFPEVSLRLRRLGAQAFTLKTGAAHWEILLRSAAIQTQTYVIASAQNGQHDEEGKSMIVDPYGNVVAQCSDQELTFCLTDIDVGIVDAVREQMPLWKQRRRDIYGEI